MLLENPRQKLLNAINELSDQEIMVLLEAIEDLQNKKLSIETLDDPLTEFIGANNHGDLVRNIDNDLYG